MEIRSRGSREQYWVPSPIRKYDYVTIYADRQFVCKNIKEGHTKSKLAVNSSSGSSLKFSFGIITGLAAIVQYGFQIKLQKSLSLRLIKFDRDNLKSKFESRKSHRGLV